MKIQLIILLLLSLMKTINVQASNEEKQIQRSADHFLMYTMGVVGAGVAGLTGHCSYKVVLSALDRRYPDELYENRVAHKIAMIIAPVIGALIGSSIGYILECTFQQLE